MVAKTPLANVASRQCPDRHIAVGGLVVVAQTMTFASTRSELRNAIAPVLAPSHQYQHYPKEVSHHGVHCLALGDDQLPPVVLVHGSPGSMDNWLDVIISDKLT